jgi:protease II
MIPPKASIKPFELTLHGHTRVDNYFWLRERENPDVIAYLEAENEYTQAMMAHTEGLQEQLYAEMIGRIQETDSTATYQHGNYYYYSRTVEGLQYDIYCRKQGSLEPAKWTARLRTLKTDNNWLLLKTHMGAGHFSASGRYDYLKDIAFEFAFILDRLGLAGT